MRAAIYARYSSDLQRDASIEDQIEVCTLKAKQERWQVVKTYADRAASGSNLSNRPEMMALLADARDGQFDVVISEALDRISRDQEDVAAIYKRLKHSDVAIVTLAEGHVDELHIGLKGTMNALFLKDLALKIRRGQRGRINLGFSAGGLSYGYDVVRELDEHGELIRGKRCINQDEARIIRRIFNEYADGKSPRKLAAELNAEGILSPRGGQWNASTINGHRSRRNGILQNEIYKGVLIHNRVRMVRDPDTGKRISRLNPVNEWIRTPVPELRIVLDDLWDRVQSTRTRYADHPAHRARRAKLLLSGLLICGECGGGYTLARPGKYGCSRHREKGTCDNGQQITVDQIEQRVLAGLKTHMNNPALLQDFVEEFHAEVQRLQAGSADIASGEMKKLETIDAQLERLIMAIADGTDTPTLRNTVLRMEEEKSKIQKRLKVSKCTELSLPLPNLTEIFHDKIDHLESSLTGDPKALAEATPLVRSLIDRIILSPTKRRGRMRVEVEGRPEGLFLLSTEPKSPDLKRMLMVVAEEGFEPPTRGL